MNLKTTDGRDFQVKLLNADFIEFRYGRLDDIMSMDEYYPINKPLFTLKESLCARGVRLSKKTWEQITALSG